MAATAPKPLRCLVCGQDLDTYQTLNHSIENHAKQLLAPISTDSSSDVLIVNVQCEPDSFSIPIGRLILMISSETTLKELHSFFHSIWLGCSCPKPHEGCFVQDGKEYRLNAASNGNKSKKGDSSSSSKLVDADAAEGDNNESDDDEEDNLSVSDFDDDDEENQVVAMSDIKISQLLRDEKDWCEYNFDMDKTTCIGIACVKKFVGMKMNNNTQNHNLPPSILQNTTSPKFASKILVLIRNYRDVKTQQLFETAKNSPRVGMCTPLKKLEIGNQGTIRLIGGGGSNQTMVELKKVGMNNNNQQQNQNSAQSKAKKAAPSSQQPKAQVGKHHSNKKF